MTVRAPWFEPDGTPTEPSLCPHDAIWDHEGRKWDEVAAGSQPLRHDWLTTAVIVAGWFGDQEDAEVAATEIAAEYEAQRLAASPVTPEVS